MKVDVTISCCLCPRQHETQVELPDGWDNTYSGIDAELGFCPDHSSIAEWTKTQCPGCVGGWGQGDAGCGLWRDFAYGRKDLTDNEMATIRRGKCPKRVNGFMVASPDGIEDIDLSETSESGDALADAILEYWQRYG